MKEIGIKKEKKGRVIHFLKSLRPYIFPSRSATFIFYLLVFSFLFLISCSKRQDYLEDALLFAGANRPELEKVLAHYKQNPEDSLKFRAAVFLIENMVYHYYFETPELNKYYKTIDSIFQFPEYIDNKELGLLLKNAGLRINSPELIVKYDIKNLSSSFLINHIDNVFKLKEYPWNENISDEVFFEYLLPYRLINEPVEDWISIYRKHFELNIDSLFNENISEPRICMIMMNYYDKLSDILNYNFPINIPPSILLNLKAGSCNELTSFSIFTMRSLGLPVGWDFTPQWANRSLGHDWAVLLTSTINSPFLFGDRVALGYHLERISVDKLAKVYRKTYSLQKESLVMQKIKEKIPVFFRNPYIKDVSSLYFNSVDVTVELTKSLRKKKDFAYITVFNNANWVPIHWAKINKDKAIFTQMGSNCAYLPMYYDMDSLFAASYPFIVDSVGKTTLLVPDLNKKITTYLKRKYPDRLYDAVRRRIVGGEFQGANKEDFSDATVLYTINDFPDHIRPVTIMLDNSAGYKFVRYVSKGYVYMAEIEFYNETGEKLSGDIIGTDGSYMNNGFDKTKVFDGDNLTYFDAPIAFGGWVGLALNKKEVIKKIRYLSWNTDNHINIGEQYELYYFDKRWISLGQKVGDDSNILIYDNVPSNALLLLRNHTKGKEERIFTYENGKQVWW